MAAQAPFSVFERVSPRTARLLVPLSSLSLSLSLSPALVTYARSFLYPRPSLSPLQHTRPGCCRSHCVLTVHPPAFRSALQASTPATTSAWRACGALHGRPLNADPENQPALRALRDPATRPPPSPPFPPRATGHPRPPALRPREAWPASTSQTCGSARRFCSKCCPTRAYTAARPLSCLLASSPDHPPLFSQVRAVDWRPLPAGQAPVGVGPLPPGRRIHFSRSLPFPRPSLAAHTRGGDTTLE